MNHNKVLSVKDYSILSEDKPFIQRKQWEIAMAIRALKDNGAVHEDAEILGVGAGKETTIYHLSRMVKQVTATDLYLDAKDWSGIAPREMIDNPEKFCPSGIDCDPKRIRAIHLDMRDMHFFLSNTFDGIFSSSSIEHLDNFEDVAKAASEMGRVLKPGGILSLSTEFKVSGNGEGWQGVLLFDDWKILKYIIEPSGCEPIDSIHSLVDDETKATLWPLEKCVAGQWPPVEALLSSAHGYTFTSIHLCLRKPTPSIVDKRWTKLEGYGEEEGEELKE